MYGVQVLGIEYRSDMYGVQVRHVRYVRKYLGTGTTYMDFADCVTGSEPGATRKRFHRDHITRKTIFDVE